MDDLISRRDAIYAAVEAADEWDGEMNPERAKIIGKAILNLPSAQPEQKKGRWINAYPEIEPDPMFMYGICSECGCKQAISNKLNFCPNCGARMEE